MSTQSSLSVSLSGALIPSRFVPLFVRRKREGVSSPFLSLQPFIFPLRTAFLRSQTEHLYGLRHRRTLVSCRRRVYRYTAADHCFAPVRPNSVRGRTRAPSLLAIQIGGNFLSAFLTSCIGREDGRGAASVHGFCPRCTSAGGQRTRRNLSLSLIKTALAILRTTRAFKDYE